MISFRALGGSRAPRAPRALRRGGEGWSKPICAAPLLPLLRRTSTPRDPPAFHGPGQRQSAGVGKGLVSSYVVLLPLCAASARRRVVVALALAMSTARGSFSRQQRRPSSPTHPGATAAPLTRLQSRRSLPERRLGCSVGARTPSMPPRWARRCAPAGGRSAAGEGGRGGRVARASTGGARILSLELAQCLAQLGRAHEGGGDARARAHQGSTCPCPRRSCGRGWSRRCRPTCSR